MLLIVIDTITERRNTAKTKNDITKLLEKHTMDSSDKLTLNREQFDFYKEAHKERLAFEQKVHEEKLSFEKQAHQEKMKVLNAILRATEAFSRQYLD